MSDDLSEDTITAQIQQIVRSRTRDVLPVVDGKPIHVPRHKPILPFLTGNSFVTIGGMTEKVSDDAYTAPSSVDIPEDARTGKMMGQLIELVRRREQSRQCVRAVQELNCCVLCEHIPTSEEMYKSQFVVHLNSVTHITGAFGRQAVIKTISRFRMYIYLFGIVVLGLCLGLTLGSKHHVTSQPRNTSSLMNSSTQDIKGNYDDSFSSKEILIDEMEEALSGKKQFETQEFYPLSDHPKNIIPDMHDDDKITSVYNQDPYGNVDDSEKDGIRGMEDGVNNLPKDSKPNFEDKKPVDIPQVPSSYSETDINSLYESAMNIPKVSFEDEDEVRAGDDTYDDDSSSSTYEDSWYYSQGTVGCAGVISGAGSLCSCCGYVLRKRKRKGYERL